MEDTDLAEGAGHFRDKAAEWFAIMRGPDAEMRRFEFEAWLAGSPAHRRAYNRIAETFSYGKFLKNEPADAANEHDKPAISSGPRGRNVRVALAVGAVIAICSAVSFLWAAPPALLSHGSEVGLASKTPAPHSVRLETAAGQVRSFKLADGSKVTLDTGSVLLVEFDARRRNLRLLQGHVRFDVAHEARLFVVAAGRGAVTARGTVFDVTIASDRRVKVELLRGSVDVDLPPHGREKQPSRVRLLPGEHYGFTDEVAAQGRRLEQVGIPSQPPEGVRDYDNVRLADLLADLNRYSPVPIATATRDLDEMRISGTFRITEPARVVRNLAHLLGLSLVHSPSSVMLARTCAGVERENCLAPS